jgi:hypothetical protein
MSGHQMRTLARRTLSIGFVGVIILAGGNALATIRGPLDLTVSCDGITIQTGTTVNQNTTGNYKVRQNTTSPTSSSHVWAVSAQGNSLPHQTISNGDTAIWSSVLPSSYTTKVYRNGAANCNGIGFGHGNYTWNYTVTYQG